MKLVNVGCGRHRHSDWVNLDLKADGPDVLAWDLRAWWISDVRKFPRHFPQRRHSYSLKDTMVDIYEGICSQLNQGNLAA